MSDHVVFGVTWMQCSDCRVPFAILKHHVDSLIETGDDFYCPNGHANSFCTEDDYEDDEDDSDALTRAHAENRKLRAKLRELGHDIES